MANEAEKRILLLFTGGTVVSNVAENPVQGKVESEPDNFSSILDTCVRIVRRNWHIEIQPTIRELFNLDSSNITPENWVQIIEEIEREYDSYDAFVVLHGTNTMGYTCAALSFAFENINKPVIVTGAQVPLGYLGSDATTNLVNALRLAVWGYHSIKGVMAVFGSKIISGVRVKKGTDFDYDPFQSFIAGSLGQIGRFMRIDQVAMDKHISYLSKVKPLAIQGRSLSVKKEFRTNGIVSLTEFPGMSDTLIPSLVDQGLAEAFIFRAFGAGDTSARLFPSFEFLREKRIPVVVTTQAPNGVASFQVNETGQYLSENELAIPAHNMSIESITTKLAWLLGQDCPYEQFKDRMLNDLHGEITVEQELL